MSAKKNTQPRQGTCVYCGAVGDVEDEHVLARRLFVGGNPDPIKVDACKACNQEKSQGERDLRNFIALEYWGSQHPDIDAHIERILQDDRTAQWLWEQIQTAPPAPVLDENGNVIDSGFKIDFNEARIETSIEMIIRGLWFHETGRNYIPLNDIPVLVERKERKDAKVYIQELTRRFPDSTIRQRGNNAVWWIPFIASEKPEMSAWLLCLNNQVLWLAYTGSLARARAEYVEARDASQGPPE